MWCSADVILTIDIAFSVNYVKPTTGALKVHRMLNGLAFTASFARLLASG